MSDIDIDSIDCIEFDLNKSYDFFEDIINYEYRDLQGLWKLLNNRNMTIKHSKYYKEVKTNNPKVDALKIWKGNERRPFLCNDRYNKIIMALLNDTNFNQKKDQPFATYTINDLRVNPSGYVKPNRKDKQMYARDEINKVISAYLNPIEPTKYNLSDKKVTYNKKDRRRMEKALGKYLINKFIKIRDYYYIKKAESVKNEKEAQREYVKKHNYQPFKCICGYEGIVANKLRHIQTPLCDKKTRKILFDELPFNNSINTELIIMDKNNYQHFKCLCGYEGIVGHKSRHIKTTLCEKRTRILLFCVLPLSY